MDNVDIDTNIERVERILDTLTSKNNMLELMDSSVLKDILSNSSETAFEHILTNYILYCTSEMNDNVVKHLSGDFTGLTGNDETISNKTPQLRSTTVLQSLFNTRKIQRNPTLNTKSYTLKNTYDKENRRKLPGDINRPTTSKFKRVKPSSILQSNNLKTTNLSKELSTMQRITPRSSFVNVRQRGGAIDICNGVYTDQHNPLNHIIGLVKTLDELKHDFDKSPILGGYMKDIESKYIYNIDKLITQFKQELTTNNINDTTTTNVIELADNIMTNALVNNDNEILTETEWSYYTSMLKFITDTCGLENLNIIKAIKIPRSKTKGLFEKYDDVKIETLKQQGLVFEFEKADDGSSSGSSDDGVNSRYFYSKLSTTIDKVEQSLDINQLNTYFQDNPTSFRRLMPIVGIKMAPEGIYTKNQTTEFEGKSNRKVLSYAAGLIDPATTGAIPITTFRNVDNTDIKNRIQFLQDISAVQSISARMIMAECLNEFMGYFGVEKPDFISVSDGSYMTSSLISKSERDYLVNATVVPGMDVDEGIEQSYMRVIFTKNKARDAYDGIEFLTGFPGTLHKKPETSLSLKIKDLTIKNIADLFKLFNSKENKVMSVLKKIFSSSKRTGNPISSDLKTFSSVIATMGSDKPEEKESYLRMFNFAEYIIEKSAYASTLQGQERDWLFTQIIISMKSLGDSIQVKYVNKMDTLIKDSFKSEGKTTDVSVYISSSDKNVAGESLFYNTPFLINGTGIRPHSTLFRKYKAFFDSTQEKIALESLTGIKSKTQSDGKEILSHSTAIIHNLGVQSLNDIVVSLNKSINDLKSYHVILAPPSANKETTFFKLEDTDSIIIEFEKSVELLYGGNDTIDVLFNKFTVEQKNIHNLFVSFTSIISMFSDNEKINILGLEPMCLSLLAPGGLESPSSSIDSTFRNMTTMIGRILETFKLIINKDDPSNTMDNTLLDKITDNIQSINKNSTFQILASCNFSKIIRNFKTDNIKGFTDKVDLIVQKYKTSMSLIYDNFNISLAFLAPEFNSFFEASRVKYNELIKQNYQEFIELKKILSIFIEAIENKDINTMSKAIEYTVSKPPNPSNFYLFNVLIKGGVNSSIAKNICSQLNFAFKKTGQTQTRQSRGKSSGSSDVDKLTDIAELEARLALLQENLNDKLSELEQYQREKEAFMNSNGDLKAMKKRSKVYKNLFTKFHKDSNYKESFEKTTESAKKSIERSITRETAKLEKKKEKRTMTYYELMVLLNDSFGSLDMELKRELQELKTQVDSQAINLSQDLQGLKTMMVSQSGGQVVLPRLKPSTKKKNKYSYKLNGTKRQRRKALNEGVVSEMKKRNITLKNAAIAKKGRLNMLRIYRRKSDVEACKTITDDMAYLDKKYKLGTTNAICGKSGKSGKKTRKKQSNSIKKL